VEVTKCNRLYLKRITVHELPLHFSSEFIIDFELMVLKLVKWCIYEYVLTKKNGENIFFLIIYRFRK